MMIFLIKTLKSGLIAGGLLAAFVCQAAQSDAETVDDKQVFSTGPVSSSNYAQTPLVIPVSGAKELTLIVTEGGNGPGGDLASWADAYLSVTSNAQVKSPVDYVNPLIGSGGPQAIGEGGRGQPVHCNI